MNKDTQKPKNLLDSSDYTCVLRRRRPHQASRASRVMSFIKSGLDLSGYSAADRIVGRAAALLFVAGIREVYADVISDNAVAVLEAHGIPYDYSEPGRVYSQPHRNRRLSDERR